MRITIIVLAFFVMASMLVVGSNSSYTWVRPSSGTQDMVLNFWNAPNETVILRTVNMSGGDHVISTIQDRVIFFRGVIP